MRDFFTKDVGWKVFSLGLAIILYFTVRAVRESSGETFLPREARITRTFMNVPVLVTSSAADVRQFNVEPASVHVTVSGRVETINALQAREIRVTVDLTGIEAAKDLKKRIDVSSPPGVTLVVVTPDQVDVVVPPQKTK